MGFVDKVHVCDPPTEVAFELSVNRLFECDHCKATWRVSSMWTDNELPLHRVSWVRVDQRHFISFKEKN